MPDRFRRAPGLLVLLFLSSLIAAGFVAGLVVSGRASAPSDGVSAAAPAQVAPAPGKAAAAAVSGGLPDLSTVAETGLKSSTNISSTQVIRMRRDPIFEFFYGGQPNARQATSLGSGVIVSSDGYVLTNSHVIQDARAEIKVTLPDNRELPGKLVGIDTLTDLAVVKVAATGLPTLPWGDSDKLRVAQWVLAIGNPYQFSRTVTLGIVSAVNRAGAQLGAYDDFIQTDAAINPGNSGGALIDAEGRLVGINTMIYSETGGYQGIGFAIPANLARRIMQELIKNGRINWGSLGADVEVEDLTPDLADQLEAPSGHTAFVYSLQSNGDAYGAGLRPGDIIVSLAGQAIPDLAQFGRTIADQKPGTTAKVVVSRRGRNVTLSLPVVAASATRGSGG